MHPDERSEDISKLDEIIRQAAPALKPAAMPGTMYGDMQGYGLVPYQAKSMKHPGQWPLIALKAQKHYISLYACVVIDGRYIAEMYQLELGKVSCGKSCIRFKKLDDVNLGGLKNMLADINRRYEAGEKLYGV